MVKEDKKDLKVYKAPFTCAVTREIHVEIATDNKSEMILLSFRRFIVKTLYLQSFIVIMATSFSSS